MNKRNIFGALALLATAPFFDRKAEAARTSATFSVPNGVRRIRVKSYKHGKIVIDTMLNVEPGQIFKIEAV